MEQFLGWLKFQLSCLRFEAKQVICGSKRVRIGYNLQTPITEYAWREVKSWNIPK